MCLPGVGTSSSGGNNGESTHFTDHVADERNERTYDVIKKKQNLHHTISYLSYQIMFLHIFSQQISCSLPTPFVTSDDLPELWQWRLKPGSPAAKRRGTTSTWCLCISSLLKFFSKRTFLSISMWQMHSGTSLGVSQTWGPLQTIFFNWFSLINRSSFGVPYSLRNPHFCDQSQIVATRWPLFHQRKKEGL